MPTMSSTTLAWSFVSTVFLLGCGGAAGVAEAETHHGHQHSGDVAAGGTPRLVTLPELGADGEPREVRVLVDNSDLKLVMITLRDGTELSTHTAPVPVTIHVLEGAGTASSGKEQLRYERGAIWLLEADQPHAIKPDAGVTMVLLVHYLVGPRSPVAR